MPAKHAKDAKDAKRRKGEKEKRRKGEKEKRRKGEKEKRIAAQFNKARSDFSGSNRIKRPLQGIAYTLALLQSIRMSFMSFARWKRLLAVVLLFISFLAGKNPEALADTNNLRVMSYNVRFASLVPPNSWPERRPLVSEVLKETAPDLIGTQEGVYYQLKEMAADLNGYDWIGLGRNGGSRGEFMAVFYRKSRLEPLEFDHFWLSDTPSQIGSMTWGPTLPRMVTWVKFQDRQTRRQFYFFNTHFDHKVQVAREKSAELLRERIATLDPALPVLLAGDFNAAAPTNKAYQTLVADGFFQDTWDTAKSRSDSITGTFNGFKQLQPQGGRIDWILTRGKVEVERLELITFSKDGKFPSDHLPVLVDLSLPNP